jgi:hypothetical protein
MALASDVPMKRCAGDWHDGFSSAMAVPMLIRSKPHYCTKISSSYQIPWCRSSKMTGLRGLPRSLLA